jgi:cell wall-associated NlpC family hydrolase
MKYFENDINYQKFERVVKSWEGTPYRHLTIVKKRGADCALFIMEVLKECRFIDDYKYEYYPKDWHYHTNEEYILDMFLAKAKDNIRSGLNIEVYKYGEVDLFRGDILSFKLTSRNISNHVAFYLQSNELVHSLERIGVHRIELINFFKERITNIHRIMEI